MLEQMREELREQNKEFIDRSLDLINQIRERRKDEEIRIVDFDRVLMTARTILAATIIAEALDGQTAAHTQTSNAFSQQVEQFTRGK